MREIKFRAWAEKTVDNRWDYVYSLAKAEKLESYDVDFDEYEARAKYARQWDESHSEDDRYTTTKEMITDIKVNKDVQRPYGYEVIEVMQFTGLNDKNGKEIYEGDVLRGLDTSLYPQQTVRWSDTQASFVCDVFVPDYGEVGHGISQRSCSECEVIGNIYENPELLTKE